MPIPARRPLLRNRSRSRSRNRRSGADPRRSQRGRERRMTAPTRRQIAAVVAGNALEFYDFVTYSFFAVQIGRTLFPGDAEQSLILSLAAFGIGFVTRPLGAFVIGRIADRRGRKPAMILSFTLMGIGITGLA